MNVVARGVRTTVVRAPEPGLDLVLIGANATLGKRNNTKKYVAKVPVENSSLFVAVFRENRRPRSSRIRRQAMLFLLLPPRPPSRRFRS